MSWRVPAPWAIEWFDQRPNMGWPGDHTPCWVRHPNCVMMVLDEAIRVSKLLRNNSRKSGNNITLRLVNVGTGEIIMADIL